MLFHHLFQDVGMDFDSRVAFELFHEFSVAAFLFHHLNQLLHRSREQRFRILRTVGNETPRTGLVEKRYSRARAERIFTQNRQMATIVRYINTILGLLLNAELSKIEKPSPDDRRGYEEAVALQRKIYRDFGVAFQNAKVLTNIYAELPCPLDEKPKCILDIDEQLLDHTFQETYYINTKKQTEINLELTKCYIFDSAANYLNFLLLNLMQLNLNICLCQNCGELFVAKTKKKTLYCDRVQPDSNKKCNEILSACQTD